MHLPLSTTVPGVPLKINEVTTEDTDEDESDDGGRNGALVASLPCIAALSNGYKPIAQNSNTI